MIRKMQIALMLGIGLGLARAAQAEQPTAITYSIVQLEKGNVQFDLIPEDLDETGKPENWLHVNDAGKLTCDADISKVVIAGAAPSIDRINRTVRDLAEQARCTHDQDIAAFEPRVNYISTDVVSISVAETSYGKGANGSCHTHYEHLNFDLIRGAQYRLPDILRSDAFPKIRQDILAAFRNDPDMNQEPLASLLDHEFWSMGFFVKDHKLYVDLGSYLKSCADGPFFPVEINSTYIDTERAPPWLESALNITFPRPSWE